MEDDNSLGYIETEGKGEQKLKVQKDKQKKNASNKGENVTTMGRLRLKGGR